jgi:hypothetical protein
MIKKVILSCENVFKRKTHWKKILRHNLLLNYRQLFHKLSSLKPIKYNLFFARHSGIQPSDIIVNSVRQICCSIKRYSTALLGIYGKLCIREFSCKPLKYSLFYFFEIAWTWFPLHNFQAPDTICWSSIVKDGDSLLLWYPQ